MTEDQESALLERLAERFADRLNAGRALSDAEHSAHHQWIKVAIDREARKERIYGAIIDKSLAGLVWTAIVVIGKSTWEYVISRVPWLSALFNWHK